MQALEETSNFNNIIQREILAYQSRVPYSIARTMSEWIQPLRRPNGPVAIPTHPDEDNLEGLMNASSTHLLFGDVQGAHDYLSSAIKLMADNDRIKYQEILDSFGEVFNAAFQFQHYDLNGPGYVK